MTEEKVVCSGCGREAPIDPRELATWRHGTLLLEEREIGDGLLLCPDCDTEDREWKFDEGGGD